MSETYDLMKYIRFSDGDDLEGQSWLEIQWRQFSAVLKPRDFYILPEGEEYDRPFMFLTVKFVVPPLVDSTLLAKLLDAEGVSIRIQVKSNIGEPIIDTYRVDKVNDLEYISDDATGSKFCRVSMRMHHEAEERAALDELESE